MQFGRDLNKKLPKSKIWVLYFLMISSKFLRNLRKTWLHCRALRRKSGQAESFAMEANLAFHSITLCQVIIFGFWYINIYIWRSVGGKKKQYGESKEKQWHSQTLTFNSITDMDLLVEETIWQVKHRRKLWPCFCVNDIVCKIFSLNLLVQNVPFCPYLRWLWICNCMRKI